MLRFYAEPLGLRVLPVDLPPRSFPVVLITLKNRAPCSTALRFIEHLRAFSKPLAAVVPAKRNAAREA